MTNVQSFNNLNSGETATINGVGKFRKTLSGLPDQRYGLKTKDDIDNFVKQYKSGVSDGINGIHISIAPELLNSSDPNYGKDLSPKEIYPKEYVLKEEIDKSRLLRILAPKTIITESKIENSESPEVIEQPTDNTKMVCDSLSTDFVPLDFLEEEEDESPKVE